MPFIENTETVFYTHFSVYCAGLVWLSLFIVKKIRYIYYIYIYLYIYIDIYIDIYLYFIIIDTLADDSMHRIVGCIID